MASSGPPRVRMSARGWLVVAVAPALAVMALSALRIVDFGTARFLFLVSLAWAIAFAFVSWRRLDDPSREAYKFASFWGAGFGLVIGALGLFVLIAFPGAPGDLVQGWIDGYIAQQSSMSGNWRAGPVGFYLGVLSIVGVQMLLFVAVWVGWWVRQRLGAKSD